MNPSLLQCPACRAGLLDGVFNQPEPAPCPACGTPLRAEIFPAFFRRLVPGQAGEAVMLEGESSCFFHPQKKAVQTCQGCGRFLCALCDCELKGQHFCPSCLEAGRTKGKIKNLENQRMLYDSIALVLALAPILVFYFTFITAPIAVFMAIRYWNAPRSLVHRSRVRLWFALILGVAQILIWLWVLYLIIK